MLAAGGAENGRCDIWVIQNIFEGDLIAAHILRVIDISALQTLLNVSAIVGKSSQKIPDIFDIFNLKYIIREKGLIARGAPVIMPFPLS